MHMEIQSHQIESEEQLHKTAEDACNLMEEIYRAGQYPKLTIRRDWSIHNPVITGEMALPGAYRWFLMRELKKLLRRGAELTIHASRERRSMTDPALFDHADEGDWDITQKKLFLFSPERIDISMNRLEH